MDTLLERIWSDVLEERTNLNGSPISYLLTSLLSVPVLSLDDTSSTAASEPFVSYGGYEVLPGASLADVLLEEMGIEIDETTVVLVERNSSPVETRGSTEELGRAVGRILLELSMMNSGTKTSGDLPKPLISATATGRPLQQPTIN
ncbi:hypothetical protein [Sulfitobacter sp. JB4-11]|uniref:hypothetical protein n=1 Tax=Sulfitobacter rhodophyticola TaxID=3238304 RepID=UPI00351459E7